MAIKRKVKSKPKAFGKKQEKKKALKKPTKKKTKVILVKPKIKKVLNKLAHAAIKTENKKAAIGSDEIIVGQSKFSSGSMPVPKFIRSVAFDLPHAYGKDLIVLQVRDPWWMHTYWEVTNNTWDKLKSQLKDNFYSAKKVLRVYDVTNINFNGKNAHKFFDIEIGLDALSWYINVGEANRSWCVDLGLRLASGEFITIVRSNVVQTPSDGPSWITDEEWMIPEDIFARLYGMGFGFGQTSVIGKAWAERLKREILSSGGLASMSSPSKPPQERKFWAWVDCELVVYGATESDAKVTVQGKEVKLRPDGTFTLRFALPDGKQVIPVKATSRDGLEEHTITPIVTRETRKNILLKEAVKK